MSEDFIELYPNAINPAVCAMLVERFNRSNRKLRGSTGGGVDVSLKDSWDITLDDHEEWQDAANLLNTAMLTCFKAYLRKHPYTAIAPMSLRMPDPITGEQNLLGPTDIHSMPDSMLQALALKLFRPGAINIQKYIADQGGYPYWHCELYPKMHDPQAETLHRTLLWTVYLNDDFVVPARGTNFCDAADESGETLNEISRVRQASDTRRTNRYREAPLLTSGTFQ